MSQKDRFYQVLARKYRPKTFADLIGQDALVQTLKNAIEQNRIAHAFILTGVRGVGKTTTARIIARALNCTHEGRTEPTITPCGECENCVSIAQDRHVDVVEMDAASRTGIDDIREILDGVRYQPVMGRYKIYIIDEVHMLSKQAFNALLKTLEEPPEQVKFVFATTEIQKVPVTVLSRCQRFDLKRISHEQLTQHFSAIAKQEGVDIEEAAVQMVARLADGSVRDGLSLLDQVIAQHFGANDAITLENVRHIIGLTDRVHLLTLFDVLMQGNVAAVLDKYNEIYSLGADPNLLLQEVAEVCHEILKAKIAKDSSVSDYVSQEEKDLFEKLTMDLSVPSLSRQWQMILKGMQEVGQSSYPHMAMEMLLMRMAYVATLATPESLMKERGEATISNLQSPANQEQPSIQGNMALKRESTLLPSEEQKKNFEIVSFPQLIELCEAEREPLLAAQLRSCVHLVSFKKGHVELRLLPEANPTLPQTLGKYLSEWTGEKWMISLSQAEGEETIRAQKQKQEQDFMDKVHQHPILEKMKTLFPDAEINVTIEE